MSEKNVLVAYLAWIVGGWIGLHHFYLGRDRHALTWWITWGGGLGLGWMRELWRIPDYVDEANNEPEYLTELRHQARRTGGHPPFTMVRFLGQCLVGILFGYQMLSMLPVDWYQSKLGLFSGKQLNLNIVAKYALLIVIPAIVAIGVHLVGNIGRERVRLKTALLGAYVSLPFLLFSASNVIYTALMSAVNCNINKNKTWHVAHQPTSRSVCCRLLVLIICCNLYSSLWLAALSQNAYVTTKDGQKVLIKDAIKNFFNSPAWEQMKDTFRFLWTGWRTHGYRHAWDEFVMKIDPEGETHAYRVLGLTSKANESEISAAYRQLAKQHHPDKVRDLDRKEAAQERFMEIQQAYETISSIKTRRTKKSAKTQTTTNRAKKTEL